MKVYQANELKNIALVGSSGSGKTTIAEAMLFAGGVIARKGDIENNNTVSDYREIEHEQGRSVYSTVLYTEFQNRKINIFDTPGLDDFKGQVVSSLVAADSAILVINAQQGYEVGTELVVRNIERIQKPMFITINQLDHEKANFDKCIDDLHAKFGSKAVIIQYPTAVGSGFNAVIDVLKLKMYKWKPEGGYPEELEIPASEKDKAEELHNKLVEAAAENDDKLMELFFESGSLDEDQMRMGIRKGIIARSMFPIFCLSAKRDMGIRRFMEFVNNVAPNPLEGIPMLDTDGKAHPVDANQPVSIFVFKTSVEEHIGEVSYFKVITGV
ncbi:MAG TPA: GTP-binding protein, partial [Salinivirgaceae bacterium]|nr:GTP-binding protein [Salinivirgaceae bacterium]